jgi:hypothetical protein
MGRLLHVSAQKGHVFYMNEQQPPIHWSYFLYLEQDISAISRWIEFSEKNLGCYSIELARLLMVASAEVDVVAKKLCKLIKPQSKASSIHQYQKILIKEYPNLPMAVVRTPRYGLRLQPWTSWIHVNSPPNWWTANNKIKHHRAENFERANLKNVFEATTGLFVLLILLYSHEYESIKYGGSLFSPGLYAYLDGEWIVFDRNQR